MTSPQTPWFIVIITLCAALLSGCSMTPSHPSLRESIQSQNSPTPLVPVRMYAADWNGNGAYQISPDGSRLMWAARKGLSQGLFVKNIQTGVVNSYAMPAFGQWADDSRHVLLHMDNGNENTHVYELDTSLAEAKPKDLTPFPGSKSYVQSQVRNSNDLLIANNRRDAKVFDLYRYTHATGALQLLAQNPGTVGLWLTNQHGELLGRARKQVNQWIYETPLNADFTEWREIFQVSGDDTVKPLNVAADNQSLWALSNRGRDKIALVKLDLSTGVEQVIYADSRVDVSRALIGEQTQEPLAVAVEPDVQEWKFFEPRLQDAVLAMQGQRRNTRVEIGGISRDGNTLIADVLHDEGGESVLYSLDKKESTLLGESSRSRIHRVSPLPVQRALRFKSRDGLDIHAYLTLPVGDGKNLPTVVYVHGGPWDRDRALMGDPMPFFLANRGYAVLQVNFRGSSGYGRAFMEAAQGEFAGKMHTDLMDGVNHLVGQGITDTHKVAIMGASYSGYASLVGMTFTPERFACGISLVGMSDLASLLNDAPPYWDLGKDNWMRYIGNPAKPEDAAVMNAKSPLYKADQVQGPLMILHGARDARVNLNQSTRMVEALRKAGKNVDFYAYPNAGHGLYRWPDKLSYLRKTEDFLAQCLGGRSSGFDWYQLGSWVL